MSNVYTKKNRLPRTVTHRDLGGLVAPPPAPGDRQRGDYVPPPGFLYPYVKDKYGKQIYTVWTPKPVIIRWQTPEYKFNYRWMNFTCGLKEDVPKPIHKLPKIETEKTTYRAMCNYRKFCNSDKLPKIIPDVKYDTRPTYRSMYKNPEFPPEIYHDLPKTKFSSKIIEDEAVGIVPALPTYKFGPFNYM